MGTSAPMAPKPYCGACNTPEVEMMAIEVSKIRREVADLTAKLQRDPEKSSSAGWLDWLGPRWLF